jgi:hypothetical protein
MVFWTLPGSDRMRGEKRHLRFIATIIDAACVLRSTLETYISNTDLSHTLQATIEL